MTAATAIQTRKKIEIQRYFSSLKEIKSILKDLLFEDATELVEYLQSWIENERCEFCDGAGIKEARIAVDDWKEEPCEECNQEGW